MQKNTLSEQTSPSMGELLRNTRIEQGKTIQEIADELCIRRFYLDAIENMEYDKFPPMPYSIGFVRCYAKFLGLDADAVALAYKKAAYPELIKQKEEPTVIQPSKSSSKPKIWHIIVGLSGLAALIFLWSQYTKTKSVIEEEYPQEIEQTDIIVEPEIIEETPQESQVKENETEDTDSVENVEVQDSESETPVTENEVQENKSHIKIVLTGPSWIELKQGGKVLLTGVYQRGYSYEIPNGQNTVISVGRPRSVQFYVDGQLTRVATATKPRNISLDKFMQNKN